MLTPAEEGFVLTHAYVPEHVPGYVRAIAGAEPYLLEDYLCFRIEDSLLVNGYSLRAPSDETVLRRVIDSAVSRFRPGDVALIAPKIPDTLAAGQPRERDESYRLDLVRVTHDAKLRNMLRRAARDGHVESSRRIGTEHLSLIDEFLLDHPVADEIKYIFERIPEYVSAVPTARVFSARDGAGALVAFDVAEFAAGEYGFYQFNFRSRKHHVPGASDLLLDAVIAAAQSEGKRFLNLGLGINPGVRRFKEKWGARPFLSYEYCRYRPSPRGLLDVLRRAL
ncbi:MAG TPA: hypothetical protein VLT62_02045 [Candidatus Methylomirabilis sp.]|nr:hypothetical protein [Candidatus Methylomirabilis sp.]